VPGDCCKQHVEGYGVAAELFEFLRRREKEDGRSLSDILCSEGWWQPKRELILSLELLRCRQRRPSSGNILERQRMRENLGKKRSGGSYAFEKGGDSVIISHCVEGSGAQNSSIVLCWEPVYREGARLDADLLG